MLKQIQRNKGRKMKVISVMNYKGGVGKTTLTSNISAELAYRGSKVLMIDLDPQSSLTFSFVTPDDWKSHLSESKTIKNWFTFEEDKVDSFRSLIIAPKHANQAIRENQGGILNLVASHLDLINIDLELAAELKGAQFNSSVDGHSMTLSEYSAQTIHEEWDISHPMYLCPKAFDLRVQ